MKPGPTTSGISTRTVCAIAFLLPFALSVICYITIGPSLMLFIAGFFFITAMLPPLILTTDVLSRRLLIAACAIDGIAVVWLFAAFKPEVSVAQWLRCYVVLIAFTMSLVGVLSALEWVTWSLKRPRLSETGLPHQTAPAALASSAITIVMGLVWLTMPIWGSANISGEKTIARLIAVHPLFAINGALSHLGAWTHFPLAYRELMNLGQDVPYELPATIWPAVILHSLIGLGVVLPCRKASAAKNASSPA